MEAFLRKTKENLSCHDKFSVIRVVIGNEACDLDSCVCALVYSYYLHKTNDNSDVLYLPLLNIPHTDYKLHTEVTYYLELHGVSSELLTFRDQVDLQGWHSAGRLQLTLVDHNVLPPWDTSLEDAVTEVIDHHEQERAASEKVSLTLERVGSCCTLVATKLLDDENFTADSQIAKFLFGPIVLDSGNFSEALNLATPKDAAVLERLKQCGVNMSQQDVYENLGSAKSSLGGLTTLEILRKDLKVVSSSSLNIAISSVSGDLQVLLDRDDLESALVQFSADQKAQVVLLMFLSVKEGSQYSRQLGVFSHNLVYREQIVDLLSSAQEPSLELCPGPSYDLPALVLFSQGNIQASRKKVLPLIRSFLNGEKTPKTPDSGLTFDSLLDVSSGYQTSSEHLSSLNPFSSPTDGSDPFSASPSGGSSDQTADVTGGGQAFLEQNSLNFDPFTTVVQSPSEDLSPGSIQPQQSESGAVSGNLLDFDIFGGSTPSEQVSESLHKPPGIEHDPFSGFLEPATGTTEPSLNPLLSVTEPESTDTGENTSNLLDLDPFSFSTSADAHNVASDEHIAGNADQTNLDSLDLFSGDTSVLMEASPLQGVTPEVLTPDTGATPERLVSYPATPPNSYMDSGMDNLVREHNLPSFNSSEMVRKIAEKKAELDVGKDELPAGGELDAFPFTPQNSVVDSPLGGPGRDHTLPSFLSSEMVQKIEAKRTDLVDFDSPELENVKKYPFTPPNSYADLTLLDKCSERQEFHEQVAEKVRRHKESLKEEDEEEMMDGSELSTSSTGNVLAYQIGHGIKQKHDMSDNGNLIDGFEGVTSGNDFTDGRGAAQGSVDSSAVDRQIMDGSEASADEKPVRYEEGTEMEVAYNLAQDIIHRALDAYDATLCADGMDESALTSVDSEAERPKLVGVDAASPGQTPSRNPAGPTGAADGVQHSHVETDYLSSVDLLQGNLDIVTSPQATSATIKTDAEKVVAEGHSFNQIQAEQGTNELLDNRDPSLLPPFLDNLGQTGATAYNNLQDTSVDFNCVSSNIPSNSGANYPPGHAPPDNLGASQSDVQNSVSDLVNNKEDQNSGLEGSIEQFIQQMVPEIGPEGGGQVETSDGGDGSMAGSIQAFLLQQKSSPEEDDEIELDDPEVATQREAVARTIVEGAVSAAVELYKNEGEKSLLDELEEAQEVVSDAEEEKEEEEKPTEVVLEGGLAGSIQQFLHNESKGETEDVQPEFEQDSEEFSSPEVSSPDEGPVTSHVISDTIIEEPSEEELAVATEIVKKATDSALDLLQAEQQVTEQDRSSDSAVDVSEDASSPESVREVCRAAPPTNLSLDDAAAAVPHVMVTSPTEPAPNSDDEYIVTAEQPAQKVQEEQLVQEERSRNLDDDELKSKLDQLPKRMDSGSTSSAPHDEEEDDDNKKTAARPTSLESTPKRKIIPNMELLKDESLSTSEDPSTSVVSQSSSDVDIMLSVDDIKTPDDLNTPEALNDSVFEGELDWESEVSASSPVDPIPVYSAREEFEDERSWRTVTIGNTQFRMDLKVIEPYKKVLSHGGYYGDGFNAIIVFAACYLPDKRRRDYHYVMDNLFMYVISTLELLVVEDYMIVYFHGATPKHKMPNMRWLKRCYEMIDRRLKKNLKSLLIVHPTLWLKTIVLMSKLFISSKFYNKLKYVRSLQELTTMVPTEYIFIPDEIKTADHMLNGKDPVPVKKFVNQ